jgi:hypothetical protein
VQRYKVFIFNAPPRECRWEVYDWDGKLIRAYRAKDPEDARATAAEYIKSLEAPEEKQRT